MKNFVKIALASALLAAPLPAFAATGNVLFGATVDNSCAINVTGNGTLVGNAGLTTLSSTLGTAGTATVTTTSGDFSLYADAPTAWDSGVTAADSFSANVTGFTGLGSSDVDVNMSASLTSGSFQTGTYSATVVLRCE